MKKLLTIATVSLLSSCMWAQDASNNDVQVTAMEKTPVYRVNVVSRSIDAVNYQHRNGSTKINFRGTTLMPDAEGEAKIDSKAGRVEINADLKHIRDASYYGGAYLTYVLWAITPEGRPVNLGEVVPNEDHEVHLHVTSNLQAFGLMVTAEPYFSVTRPSSMTVLENVIRRDTKGWEQPVTAKYDATEKGEYTVDINSDQLPARTIMVKDKEKKVPLQLLEAQNAVAIAEAAGATQYAPDAMARAHDFLSRGEDYLRRNQSKSAIATVARGAAQAAEDARVITIRKKADERVAAERKAAEDRATEARQRADDEQRRAQDAQEAASRAQQERQAAEQAKAEALQAQQQAEQARQEALRQQQILAQQAQQAQQQAQTAEQRAEAAEHQREQMRQQLTQQLNEVLQTRDTARGLIVNMSDVLFDLNKATLKPGAKVRLARVAGIIEAHPDLKLQIEGYTDSTGTQQYNQELSERRAAAVRDFLVSQGVNMNNVTAQGYGPANPVASNSTAEGRQMNRRVDLVVNGQSIQTNAAARNAEPTGAAGSNTAASSGTGGDPTSMAAPASSNPRTPDQPQVAPNAR